MEKQRTKKEKFSLFASPVKRDRLPVPPVPPTPPGLSKAEFLDRVRRSNQACQQGEYALAVRLYSEALTADPQNCILFSNRSAAYLRLGEYSTALDDAIKARLINPKWPKGHLCLDDWGRASFNFLSLCERMDGSGTRLFCFSVIRTLALRVFVKVLEKRKEAQRLMAAPLICFRIR
ncbi:Tetratricopeptide repeat protein 28, partial [Dissostichus eleginoides]